MLGDEEGMVKTTGTDVLTDGGERHEDDFALGGRKSVSHNLGERTS